MKRRKHKNDSKANTHWDRWMRAHKGDRFKHSDRTVEGKLKKRKLREE